MTSPEMTKSYFSDFARSLGYSVDSPVISNLIDE